jgi:uncharacterized protein (DUF2249 family)
MTEAVVTLDVREDLRAGQDPFPRIMQAVAALAAGHRLVLVAPFEPVPLYGVLSRQGFAHEARLLPTGDWEISFSRHAETKAATGLAAPATCGCGGGPWDPNPVVEVDARGLEPPQPLVRILEAATTLPAGATLRARTDRRPMHLLPQLEERGFSADCQEQPDGSFVTHIRRR